MSSPVDPASQLAFHVKWRRGNLGLNQLEVWQAGGPSNTTLTEIENGRLETLTNSTAKKLDKGLQWEPGSAMAAWRDGTRPTALAGSVGAVPNDAEHYVESPGGVVDSRITNEDLYREIMRSRAEYDQIRAEVRDLSERLGRVEKHDA